MAVSGGMGVNYERLFFHQDGDDLLVEAEGLQRIARNNADFWRKGLQPQLRGRLISFEYDPLRAADDGQFKP